MQKAITHLSGALVLTITGSLVMSSCGSKPPAQTTTVNVEIPAATDAKTDAGDASKDADGKTEIADLRDSDDIDSDEPATKTAKTNIEPTDRDVEDAAPARKSSNSSASKPSSSKPKSQLLSFYDRLESKHFVAFGGVNRRSLLKRKGAIVDYKHNFIEIPGSADSNDGDLRKLQITLFPNGNEPWCAVSRIVWPQGQTPGAIDFYHGYSDGAGQRPRSVSEDFFPYRLRKTELGYESAYLPQRGLVINFSSTTNSDFNGESFRYNRNFKSGEAAFTEDFD